MGIYQHIEKNRIFSSLRDNAKEGSSPYYDLIQALKYSESIEKGLEETSSDVDSTDNLLDYFATVKIISLAKSVEILEDEEKKEIIKQLSQKAESVLGKFSLGDVIKYVKSEGKQLFSMDSSETETVRGKLLFPLVDFCILYQQGVGDEVFESLAENHWKTCINRYDDLKKYYVKNKEIFHKIFSEKNLPDILRSYHKKLIKILESLKDIKELEECLGQIRDRVYEASLKTMETTEYREVLMYEDSMRRIKRYLIECEYDQEKLITFEEAYKKFYDLFSEYIEKNGSTYSYEIPGNLADEIMERDGDTVIKTLAFTHARKEGEVKSVFFYEKPKELSLMDLVSHNIDEDDYFTYGRQQHLDILGKIETVTMIRIFEKEEYHDSLFECLGLFLFTISKACNLEDEKLIEDLLAVDQLMYGIKEAWKKGVSKESIGLSYGASMLIIASIEKILRLIYKYENGIIITGKHFQLHPLLENKEIEKVFSEDLVKGIGFFLSKYGYIGYDYRNRLAHLTDITLDEIPWSLPFTLFFLYLCVVNSVFLYYCKKAG